MLLIPSVRTDYSIVFVEHHFRFVSLVTLQWSVMWKNNFTGRAVLLPDFVCGTLMLKRITSTRDPVI